MPETKIFHTNAPSFPAEYVSFLNAKFGAITKKNFSFFLISFAQLKKVIQHQQEEIKNLRNQLKTSDKRIRELEFEVKKLRLEKN